MIFNDRRKAAGMPNPDTAVEKYGLNLPGVNKKPKRTMNDWNARASVLAAGRSGAIQEMPKTKGGITGRVVRENKKEFAKRQMNYAKKGK